MIQITFLHIGNHELYISHVASVTRIWWCIFACLQTGSKQNYGTIGEFTLILHGTEQIPAYRRNGPRIYNEDYNRKTVSSVVTFGILLHIEFASLVYSLLFQYDAVKPIAKNFVQYKYDQNVESPEINVF